MLSHVFTKLEGYSLKNKTLIYNKCDSMIKVTSFLMIVKANISTFDQHTSKFRLIELKC